MKDLDYPFNSDYIIRKKKSLKKQLLADENTKYIGKKLPFWVVKPRRI